MIDKKPFRVTNEKARSDKGEHIFAGQGGSDKSKIKDYASDLLDAREIIDKQESIIKEMRDTFTIIHQKSIAFVCEDMRTLARIQLEKSKDYA